VYGKVRQDRSKCSYRRNWFHKT